ncbi:uncharacterized protein BT62DRAFT_30621 [Guyanagaster necrorhizus]|uniref:Uncharacterized protein n=1 Tax=Guyanagaster necrorhizus TaxID=856835 RepID=A0A9P7W7Q2_9AGAR|nr:uncharacterized protein BT62DRAFT_30621 [Guyanagaster necrorhizus MCA 3950]KAG7452846.1 hypothetical protein BT62DRAFT_30621 [Guyanagaster necrorhizus MCA 3950]
MTPATFESARDRPSGYIMHSGSSLRSPRDSNNTNVDRLSYGSNRDDQTGHHRSSTYQGDCTSGTSKNALTSSSTGQETTSSTAMSAISSGVTKSGPFTSNIPSHSASSSSSLNGSAIQAGESTINSTKTHVNTDAVIGGVIGGVVILSIAALIFFIFFRRYWRMKHTAPSAEFLHPNSPFQRLNTVMGPPTGTRAVFDMLLSANGDAHITGGRSLLRSLSLRENRPPTLEKVATHIDTSVHAL